MLSSCDSLFAQLFMTRVIYFYSRTKFDIHILFGILKLMLQFHFFSLLFDAMNSLQKIGKIDFNDSWLVQNFVSIRIINELPEVTL